MHDERPSFRLRLIAAAAILLCATAQAARAEDFDVYRGVSAAKNGRAQLNAGTFKFNPYLSTFDEAHRPAASCYYRFRLTGLPHAVPVPGDVGWVVGLPGVFKATFNDVPPGHWNIAAPDGTSASVAARDVSVYAQDNRGNVVNGIQGNCN